MGTAQTDRLWVCFDEIARPDERGTAICSVIGLQCASRTLASFIDDYGRGVRDALVFYDHHVVIVRTPPRPGIWLAVKALTRGPASTVPHTRLDRAAFQAIEIASTPPEGWLIVGDLRFVHGTTPAGEIWHWIDDDSMEEKEESLQRAVELYTAGRR